MNFLIYTLSMLTLMTLITIGQLNSTVDQEVLHTSLLTHIEAERALSNGSERAVYELKMHTRRQPAPKAKKSAKRGEKGTGMRRPRQLNDQPALLNLASILLTDDALNQEMFATLLTHLYPIEDEEVKRLIEQLKEQLDKEFPPEMVEHLAAIDLQDDQLQEVWWTVLNGKAGSFSSLLDYVCYEPDGKGSKINVPFAPVALLEVVVDEVDEVVAKRDELLELYREGEIDKGAFEAELKEVCTGQYTPLLDYSPTYHPSTMVIEGTSGQLTLKRRKHSPC